MPIEKGNMMKIEHKSKIDVIFFLGGILSFVGGCTAKFIYQSNNNEPVWLNSIVVGIFVGSGFCFMSLMAISVSFLYGWKTDKARAIWSLIVGIPVFFIGLFILWKVLLNLLAL